MANLRFEGNISGINDIQLEFIRNIFSERGYTNETIFVENVGSQGDNYVASVKRIIVEKDGKQFKVIAKIAPTDDVLRKNMNTMVLFTNEHVMYTKILPKFSELQKVAGVPEEERLRYAECYGSYTEAPNEVILLEDLHLSGFSMLDRLVSLTDDTVKLILKNFAILHSLSYALKNQEPETYAALKSRFSDWWALMKDIPRTTTFGEKLESDLLEMLDEKYRDVIKGTISKLPELAAKNSKIDTNSKFSVIVQGDAWINNFMFTFEGDKAKHCCMIDYQMSKESSPASDLHYMIFNCTDYEARKKHYHNWIDYYHKSLDEELFKYSLKASSVYSRDQLDSDLLRFGKMSFGTSVVLTAVLMREGSETADFTEAMKADDGDDEQRAIENLSMGSKTLDPKTILRFKNRVEGLLDSYIELGYL